MSNWERTPRQTPGCDGEIISFAWLVWRFLSPLRVEAPRGAVLVWLYSGCSSSLLHSKKDARWVNW